MLQPFHLFGFQVGLATLEAIRLEAIASRLEAITTSNKKLSFVQFLQLFPCQFIVSLEPESLACGHHAWPWEH